MKTIKKNNFFSNSKNYLLAEFFNKGIIFFTIPIFTRLLVPEEYGILSIFSSIISIFSIIIGMNFQAAIYRKFQEKDDEFSEYLGSNIIFLFATNVIFFLIIYILRNKLSTFFNITEKLFLIAIVISIFLGYIQIQMLYLRASQKSIEYAKLSIFRNLSLTVFSLILIFWLKENKYMGKVYSQLIISMMISISVIYSLLKISRFSFKKKHVFYSLNFSIPLIPHVLSALILSQFDRLIINQLLGSYEVGIYSFAYNIGTIMTVFTTSLNNAWGPILFNHLNKKEYNLIQLTTEKYAKIIFFIALGLTLFSKEIVMIMADKKYFVALNLVPIIIMGVVMTFLYTLFVNYSYYEKKTKLLSIYTIIAGFFNIGLNYLLIPKYGYVAAAWTTLASYILLFILHYINSRYILKANVIKLKKIINDLIIFIIIVIGYSNLEIDSYWKDIIIKMILTLCFFILMIRKNLKFKK